MRLRLLIFLGVFLLGHGLFLPDSLHAQKAPRKAPVTISLHPMSPQWAKALPPLYFTEPHLQKIADLVAAILEKDYTPARLSDLRDENLDEYRKIVSRAEFEAFEIERKGVDASNSGSWAGLQQIKSQRTIEQTSRQAGFEVRSQAPEADAGVFYSNEDQEEGRFFISKRRSKKEEDSQESEDKKPIGFRPPGSQSQAEKTVESRLGETGKNVEKIREWFLKFTGNGPDKADSHLYRAQELFHGKVGFGAEGEISPVMGKGEVPERPMGFQAPGEADSKYFYRDPKKDSKELIKKLRDPERGLHSFYRLTAVPMRRRFVQLLKSPMPPVFLHGDVHVENYVRMNMGATLTDLDQAVFGPYGFDIARFLGSLALFLNKKEVPGEVLSAFRQGYLEAIQNLENPFRPMEELQDIKQKEEEKTVAAYVKAEGARIKNMRENPLSPDDERVRELMENYLERGSPLNGKYTVLEAGYTDNLGMSSMGRKRYYVLLKPSDENEDQILLEFKPVDGIASDGDYMDAFKSPAERVLLALKLYAPKREYALGTASLEDQDYWVRGVQPQRIKLSYPLNPERAQSLALAVGSQLGRAHGLSWLGADKIAERFARDFEGVVQSAYQMTQEIEQSYRHYLKNLDSKNR